MSEKKFYTAKLDRQAPPCQPDYQDEISKAQLEAIRHLADPHGERATSRILLYPETW